MTTSLDRRGDISTLIIDDDIKLLDSLERLVDSAGYRVEVASSWEAGLSAFSALSPELVIADYNLPGSSHGLKLLAEIRNLRPSVRLILISGFVRAASLQQAEHENLVDRVVSKGDLELTSVLLEEVADAVARSERPTDWSEFAGAYLAAGVSDATTLDATDHLLASSMMDPDNA